MKILLAFLLQAFLFSLAGKAQLNRYIIQFTNKAGTSFSLSTPGDYLSPKALERRSRQQVAIDSTDLPVVAAYLDSVRLSGAVTILNASKWLNQVAIQTTDSVALQKIAGFQFVKSSQPIAPRSSSAQPSDKFAEPNLPLNTQEEIPQTELANIYNYGQSYGQVHLHQGEFLHNHGFSGQGMHLAVIDAGFPGYVTMPAFDSARINNRFTDTWDFVTNQSNVNGANNHGTICLSTIAANIPGTFVGTAPQATFNLYRSEDAASEYPIEEHFMSAALERADSVGSDLASISLGYYHFDNPSFNYSYANMNGNTTISASAADLAARKGMLVVVANGNEGTNSWHYLITPADADSVLAVGAVNTSGIVANFSSYGPSSDGQVKPGVAAVGWQATGFQDAGAPRTYNGTSLACPNMAGLATCLWQAFPEENNMGIISALQQSATKASAPDDRMGYGIPDMKKAFAILLKRFYTQQIQQAGCNTILKWSAKTSANISYIVERKLPTDVDFVSIYTSTGTGNFHADNFSYTDDLSSLPTPISIDYRIKVNLDTDTSFYFTPVTIQHQNVCASYTFIGDGDWNNAANWGAGVVPPAVLPAGSSIIIDTQAGGECVLN
ncbi:MAG: hypothetical protein EOP51_22585, partial [Sphingobacteriales bacterium]